MRRELERQAEKENRVLPKKVLEKVKVMMLADKTLWNQGIRIMEANNMPAEQFLNIALKQLIIANEQENGKLK